MVARWGKRELFIPGSLLKINGKDKPHNLIP
jgi:hypothetical protein